jgi:hypothetical protein
MTHTQNTASFESEYVKSQVWLRSLHKVLQRRDNEYMK